MPRRFSASRMAGSSWAGYAAWRAGCAGARSQAVTSRMNGRIETRTALLEDPPRVLIEIRDTGPGLPSEVLPRIFEPFYTTKEVGKGTGLGLAIAYGIIQEHAGKIHVESEVGSGTRFHLEFPLSRNSVHA